jgi:hypothetical protein
VFPDGRGRLDASEDRRGGHLLIASMMSIHELQIERVRLGTRHTALSFATNFLFSFSI